MYIIKTILSLQRKQTLFCVLRNLGAIRKHETNPSNWYKACLTRYGDSYSCTLQSAGGQTVAHHLLRWGQVGIRFLRRYSLVQRVPKNKG